MYRPRVQFRSRLVTRLVTVVGGVAVILASRPWLLAALPVAPAPIYQATQDSSEQDRLEDLKKELDNLDKQENRARRVSYENLLPYLPPGTRMTSGYRSPQAQLSLICRYAQAYRIVNSCSAMDLGRPETWQPALLGLRAQGVVIASPNHTPHATDKVVFDMAGPDLAGIKRACERVRDKGLAVFTAIIPEPENHCVHVEIASWPAEALTFGRKLSSGNDANASDSTSDDEVRRERMQQLLRLHESEADPLKKIDYDRERKLLIDPLKIEDIKRLDDEIGEHQQEANRLKSDKQKGVAVNEVSSYMQNGEFELAEQKAKDLNSRYPDSQTEGLVKQIGMRRLVDGAIHAFVVNDCEKADQLITEALVTSKDDQTVRVKQQIDACLAGSRTRWILIIVFGVVLLGSVVAALYFLLRPKKWVLEAVDGQCTGQVFPLHKEEIVIGAVGPPDGEADIVICDSKRMISRLHCVVLQEGRHLYLRDESANGTWVNSLEIEQGTFVRIRNGDEISLANAVTLLLRPLSSQDPA